MAQAGESGRAALKRVSLAKLADAWNTPWYFGWNVIAVSIVLQTVLFAIALGSFTFLVPSWTQDFGVQASRIVLASTLMSIGLTAAAPFIGRLADTASMRLLMSAGLVVFSIGLVLIAGASKAWHLLAVYALFMPVGLAACTTLPGQVLAARWFPERRGFAIGIVNLGFVAAGVVGPPLATALLAAMSWRSMFQIFALAAAALIPLALLVVRNAPAPAPAPAAAPAVTESAQGPGDPPADGLPALPPAWTVRQILSSRVFWLLIFIGSVTLAAFGGLAVNFFSYAAERGLKPAEIAGLLSALALTGFVTVPLWGLAADKVEHRYLFTGIGLVAALGCVGVAYAQGLAQVALAMFLLGAPLGGFAPLIAAAFVRQFGAASLGRASGLGMISLFISSFGAPLVARLNEIGGGFAFAFLVFAVACLPTSIAGWMIRSARPA
jgi:MFS family permease